MDEAGTRVEHDSMGELRVPAAHYWGAQTQRSLENFRIGGRMPIQVIRAMAEVKQACAMANAQLGVLSDAEGEAIAGVARDIAAGVFDDEFPLVVFQTGSGTQTNANLNEVIANRANELAGSERGSNVPLHPSNHVNASQSTNDTFVTAMHVAGYALVVEDVLPAVTRLRDAFAAKAQEWAGVVKVGRTHLMDATPLTVGQEWSGYAAALTDAIAHTGREAAGLLEVALGGTAVGTGMNAPPGFAQAAVGALAHVTGHPFVPASNAFAAQATLDPMVRTHAALKNTSVALFKIANDLRWAASGPRAGLRELRIPANEPGSTIMPGKTNPTQAEAMLQVCLAVIGNDVTISMAGAEGNFELNAFRPVVIESFVRSATLLQAACDSLRERLVEGTQLDERRLNDYVSNSVMVVTALSPVVGYEKAAQVAKLAIEEDLTVREAAERCGLDPRLVDDIVAAALGGS